MARALYDRLVDDGHGDPLRLVMATLGHAHPQVTERYLGIQPDRERRNDLLAGSNLLSVPRTNVVEFGKLGLANG
jgi:integrase